MLVIKFDMHKVHLFLSMTGLFPCKSTSNGQKKTSKVSSSDSSWKWTIFGIVMLPSMYLQKKGLAPKNIHAGMTTTSALSTVQK